MAEIENKEVVETTVENGTNQNANSYEEKLVFADRVKAKEATMKPGFVKGLYSFVMFIAVWFVDVINSFKTNPSKIGAYLIALPGIFIGFFMNFEIDSIYPLDVKYASICMFILVMCGCINIFEASGIIKKRDLKDIIIAGVLSIVIFVTGLMYILDVVNTTSDTPNVSINSTNIKSFICVGISMACGIVGTIIAFIFRDKNYKKDKF